ncbi:hypothetical protein GX51_01727 [Blastomyces parvus]|uniref:Uncharacterized protein n=1 Tax=Blastomyces parvus TaxID=2060905 RepID=A0A2B7XFQ7_9EURO|nr:hypothetical protein GX51_01727 [Blastomyces parvus]
MEFEDIRLLLELLQEANVPVCVVVKQGIELRVRGNDLEAAASIFESKKALLEKADEIDLNIYTEYKRGFPRFRFCSKPSICVVLFTDQHCHLDPLHEHVVSHQEHQDAKEYSPKILDSVSADQLATLPLPRFVPLFMGFCRTYIETQEVTAAIAAELLVDGMNLDEEWCQTHFHTSQSSELNLP